MEKAHPHMKSCGLQGQLDLYMDGDVLKGNAVDFINSTLIRRAWRDISEGQ